METYIVEEVDKKICTLPPPGWSCSRGSGHDGPCAASRKNPPHIKCESYTDFQYQYGLYKEQREAISKWIKEHNAEKHIAPGQKHRYSGAIGGAYTTEFTSTSIGVVVCVRCSCGESIDVSDYDNW